MYARWFVILLILSDAGRMACAQDHSLLLVREGAWHSIIRKSAPEASAQLKSEEFKSSRRFLWTRYKIKKTDNIWLLAARFGTSVESIQSSNSSELIFMDPGAEILIANRRGTLHPVKIKKNGGPETLDEIAGLYKNDPSSRLKLKESIIQANNLPGYSLLVDYEMTPGAYILIPGVYLDFDTFRIPFKSTTRISSNFGLRYHPVLKRQKFHEGMDFAQPYNTPVYASRSGRVLSAGWSEGYGLLVEIKHTDSTSSRYGHLSRVAVKKGQWIEGGKTMIGRVGSTGLSTGPHLHFEIRDRQGRPVNPRKKLGKK